MKSRELLANCSMGHQTYKQRINQMIRYIAIAHGGVINEGDELIAERQLAEHIGVDRQMLRESMTVLQYNGYIDCRWGRKKVALKPITEDFEG